MYITTKKGEAAVRSNCMDNREATEKQVEEEEEEKEGDDSYIDSELPLGRVPVKKT
jgi:hypothetical protein